MTRPDFSQEDLEGTPVEIAPGAWVCGELHHAGGNKNTKVNNRCFVFRLKLHKDCGDVPAGKECLFVWGLGKQMSIDKIKKLEVSTGLRAVALGCNGGGHSVHIRSWYEAFPEMKVWVAPTRVPRTANAHQLRKDFPGRWELMDNTTVPRHIYQLRDYFGDQVDCVLFNQFYTYPDEVATKAGVWQDPCCQPKLRSNMDFLTKIAPMGLNQSDPDDDVVFYHKGLRMIITGHHFEFCYLPNGESYPKELQFEGGFLWSTVLFGVLISPGRYTTSFGTTKTRIRDSKVHSEMWGEVMKWDFQYACSHHDPPTICGPIDDTAVMKGEGGVKGHMRRELTNSGELTNEAIPGTLCGNSSNALYKVLQKEPGYLKQYGNPPVLPMGGPGYDELGYRKTK